MTIRTDIVDLPWKEFAKPDPPTKVGARGLLKQAKRMLDIMAELPGGIEEARHTGLSASVFAEDLAAKLKLPYASVWPAVRALLIGEPRGPLFDKELRIRLACRILSGRDNKPEWTGRAPLWLRCICIDYELDPRSTLTKPSARVTLILLDGPHAGDIVQFPLSHSAVRTMLYRFGMPKWKQPPPPEVAGMIGWVCYGPTTKGTYKAVECRTLDADKTFNRALSASRGADRKCKNPFSCCVCPRGRESCHLACHRFNNPKKRE